MFEIENLDIYIYPRYLIKNLSLTLNKGDKLAIIGEEGNGKSTLLKAILGIANYASVTGKVHFHGNKVGYLEQSLDENTLMQTSKEFLFKNENDYYEKIGTFYKYLEIFELNEKILNQPLHTLYGGEKVKIRMLKLFLEEVDIYILDEPTNDLDIASLEWLEKFIKETDKPIIYVSHDETLLANTANKILHLEQLKKKMEPRHTLEKIDYDTYVKERLRKITHQTQIAKFEKKEKIRQKVEREQNTISRSDPHGARLLKKKMHNVKAQEKKLENTNLTPIPDIEESIFFAFEKVAIPKTKRILKIDLPVLEVPNKVLAKNIHLDVSGPMHSCIIGKNGSGKTTLLRKIKEELENRKDIKLGYMPQFYEEVFKDYETVLDFISKGKSKEEITKARMYLGNMNFTSDEMTGKISNLSNGTKAKLLLMKFVLEKCDVLLLDEPTRNVSPLSNPVIRKVLKEFDGTIISISHDRKYLEEVIDKVYLLTENGLIEQR